MPDMPEQPTAGENHRSAKPRRRVVTGAMVFPCPARGFGSCVFLARSRGQGGYFPEGGCPFTDSRRRPCSPRARYVKARTADPDSEAEDNHELP